MTFLYFLGIAAFLLVCTLLCLIVLVQEGKGGGLGGSFGGGDSGDSIFGTSTPQILKSITGWLAVGFMGFCLILSVWTSSLARQNVKQFSQEQVQGTEQVTEVLQ